MSPRMPWVGRLAYALVRGRNREFVLGDLEEAYRDERARRGTRGGAGWWYARQLASVILRSWLGVGWWGAGRRVSGRRGAGGWGDRGIRNVRHAVRGLLAAPGYPLVFVVTLGLGIGANTAVFSVVYGVLVRPLPYPDADRLVYLRHPARGSGRANVNFSFVELRELRQRARSLDAVAGIGDGTYVVLGDREPHRAQVRLVAASYLDMLAMRPWLGRTLTAVDDVRDAAPVAVLTYEYWVRAFGADSGVIGRTVHLGSNTGRGNRAADARRSVRIVGVLEPGHGITDQRDIYANYAADEHYLGAAMQEERGHRMTQGVARLAPGVTLESAQSEIRQLAAAVHSENPEAYPQSAGYDVEVVRWRDALTERARPTLLLLLGTAAAVLLIACANVANLTMTRAVRRRREFIVRTALGAGSGHVRGLMLTESLLLSVTGAAIGIALARVGVDGLATYAARFTTRTGEIHLDGTMLAMSLGIAVTAALAFAWIPRLPGRERGADAAGGAASARITGHRVGRRLQRALVVGQIAGSFVLLIAGGLLVRSLAALYEVDPGLATDRTVAMEIHVRPGQRPAERRAFWEAVTAGVTAVPGVRAVGIGGGVPFEEWGARPREIHVRGRAEPVAAAVAGSDASPDYFRTIGLPFVRGRTFSAAERFPGAPPTVIVNEALARLLFDAAKPVGSQIAFSTPTGVGPWHTVVGVVADSRMYGLDRERVYGMFVPDTRRPFPGPNLIVRATTDVGSVVEPVIRTIRAIDPDAPIENIRTLDALRAEALAPNRLNAILLGGFAALALLIASVGIGGVLSLSVSQRTNEFGIRMTLGADRGRVERMVLADGARLIAAGLVLGCGGALALARVLSGLLFGISPVDPATFIGVAAILTGAGLAAAWAPARRATRVDPLRALRAE